MAKNSPGSRSCCRMYGDGRCRRRIGASVEGPAADPARNPKLRNHGVAILTGELMKPYGISYCGSSSSNDPRAIPALNMIMDPVTSLASTTSSSTLRLNRKGDTKVSNRVSLNIAFLHS